RDDGRSAPAALVPNVAAKGQYADDPTPRPLPEPVSCWREVPLWRAPAASVSLPRHKLPWRLASPLRPYRPVVRPIGVCCPATTDLRARPDSFLQPANGPASARPLWATGRRSFRVLPWPWPFAAQWS